MQNLRTPLVSDDAVRGENLTHRTDASREEGNQPAFSPQADATASGLAARYASRGMTP